MLFITEIPHQKPPRCWTATSQIDFVQAVHEAEARSASGPILDVTTAQALVASYGLDSIEEARADEPWIAELADKFGIETKLYRSNDGEYQAEPITAFDAYKERLASDLSSLLIFENEETAKAALDDPKQWEIHGGAAARGALQRRLEQMAEI
jgi:hypothetical protein